MQRPPEYFKDKFKTGYKITEADYLDWLDSYAMASDAVTQTVLAQTLLSYRLKSEPVAAAQVTGITDLINAQIPVLLAASAIISGMQSQLAAINDRRTDPITQVLDFDFTGTNLKHDLAFVPDAPLATFIHSVDGVEVSRHLNEYSQYMYVGASIIFTEGVLTPGKHYLIITKYFFKAD